MRSKYFSFIIQFIYSLLLNFGNIKSSNSLRIFSIEKFPSYQTKLFSNDKFYDNIFRPREEIEAKGIGKYAYDIVSSMAENFSPASLNFDEKGAYKPVNIALQKIQKDMRILDEAAGNTAQLSKFEVMLLSSTVIISASSPVFFSAKVVEFLVPSMAALSAAVGISAEYIGKVAVAVGKEIAATSIQAAAEAECILANAERVKAVLPLCVGISTTASAFSLLAPSLVSELNTKFGMAVFTEIYFLMPLVAVLSASVAGLASAESGILCAKAVGVGNRRFASSKVVGRTWLSSTEQIELNAIRSSTKWLYFAASVLPSPIIGALCPGNLAFKSVVTATIAAAQAAYYLAIAEYSLSNAVDAVSIKSRAAAVADTYANQGARAGSILPFTSALAGLCAAASAAVIELLPFISSVPIESLFSMVFPSGAALFAAAASVSKARCEVDAAAASQAASTGLVGDGDPQKDPVTAVKDLIRLALKSSWLKVKSKIKKIKKNFLLVFGKFLKTDLNKESPKKNVT